MTSKFLTMTPEERLEALSRLSEHPGWQMFQEIAAMTESQALQAMLNAKTADETMLHKGAFKAVRDLRTWAEREAMALQASVQIQDS